MPRTTTKNGKRWVYRLSVFLTVILSVYCLTIYIGADDVEAEVVAPIVAGIGLMIIWGLYWVISWFAKDSSESKKKQE